MTITPTSLDRRHLLQAAAGLSLSALAPASLATAAAALPLGTVTGKGIGDFDFLAGEWVIAHRRLKDGTTDNWETFRSGATVHRVLEGMASIEELRRADGRPMGMGVRVWHPEEKLWADHWTSAGNGIVNAPQMGRFIDGDGVFISDDEMDGKPVKFRGVWDRIQPGRCRWHQSHSRDAGRTWTYTWFMDWTRT